MDRQHVQERVFFSMANLLNLEVDLIYFDTTSTYFEVDPDPDEEEALARPGRYKPVKENLEIKGVAVGDGEARVRYVLARNPLEAERDRQRREETLAELREELKKPKSVTGEEHTKAVCRVVASKGFGKHLMFDAKSFVRIDQNKVKRKARFDGKYLLTLNETSRIHGY